APMRFPRHRTCAFDNNRVARCADRENLGVKILNRAAILDGEERSPHKGISVGHECRFLREHQDLTAIDDLFRESSALLRPKVVIDGDAPYLLIVLQRVIPFVHQLVRVAALEPWSLE